MKMLHLLVLREDILSSMLQHLIQLNSQLSQLGMYCKLTSYASSSQIFNLQLPFYFIQSTNCSAGPLILHRQGFLGGLPYLDPRVNLTSKKEFNLWTESYGGHYGPAFYKYFYDRNEEIANGTIQGIHLDFNTLGVGNGLIDEYIQAP